MCPLCRGVDHFDKSACEVPSSGAVSLQVGTGWVAEVDNSVIPMFHIQDADGSQHTLVEVVQKEATFVSLGAFVT